MARSPRADAQGDARLTIRRRRTLAGATAGLLLVGGGAAAAAATTPLPKPQVVRVSADPTGKLGFVQKSLSARAGRITFVFTNRSAEPHDLAVEKAGAGRPLGVTTVIQGGRTARLTLGLKKGAYSYDCTVPGHEAAGMKGVLTVR
ncbi:MAG: hypothetical protein QOK40_928 [Miltoncostaeaceae bacterium]|nr:hypothetical protein [Miltoncostaeaceae bacterium]